ncbi:NF038122 family metalloprotease [Bradyrhizobium sp. BWC-3-1]|uniref:NF038122 family metalloprotease n=1 Tax=Bradyrhizobium sp. BWC-3-1 TaxID=3080012 RepID=UPI00293E9E6F|nr:NF038122 family metalloprotease [Bradyrhizobium sp. BWC-3-1]WOH61250.1 NF038122 family metalloprotease [Bradyrhizobium sp. BWC-3-1]
MSVTSGGITINLILDAAAQGAPDSFKNGLQQAVAILAANITDKITVNINIDYSGSGGGASAGPDSGYYETYAWTHSQLVNNASAGDATFNSLPAGSAIQGQSNVAVWNAQLKLWGVIGANDTTTDDASANFSTDINPSLLVGVALHELTHAMGRVPYGSAPDVFDLYRFTSPGVRLFQGGATAPAAFFSLDGGATKIADYGRSSDPSDFLNGGVQGSNDPFNEYYTSSTIQGLTTVDLKQLDALGFHLAVNSPTTIESYGFTTLVEAGSNYFMNAMAGGAGPSVKYGGSAYVAGQFGGWSPIGAEAISGGYEVAWKSGSQFTIWYTDGSGNYMSNAGSLAANSTSLEMFETSFHQDLNGDGAIGIPAATIESYGSTKLVQVSNNYFFNPVAGGTGPEFSYGGSPVEQGQFGAWSPVGAEAISGGYEAAWKSGSQFTIWYTDGSGNYTSNAGSLAANSTSLETFETSFHQDLNGDGTIGIPAATIESYGSTSLVQVSNNYFFNPAEGGTGPEVSYGGSPVAQGQFGAWSPVGAEAISGGYEVAWKSGSQFTIWYTDSGGKYTSNAGSLAANSTSLETFETSFHQDLNGDGTIGTPAGTAGRTTIESYGATSLVQVGNNYFFNPVAGGTGPELGYGGSPVAQGQFGAWSPVGAEAISGGYEVAWKSGSQFTIWYMDISGNYTSNAGSLAGNSTSLETFETGFHQDLNGDGILGVTAQVSAQSNLNVERQVVSPLPAGEQFHFGQGQEILLARPSALDLAQFDWTDGSYSHSVHVNPPSNSFLSVEIMPNHDAMSAWHELARSITGDHGHLLFT